MRISSFAHRFLDGHCLKDFQLSIPKLLLLQRQLTCHRNPSQTCHAFPQALLLWQGCSLHIIRDLCAVEARQEKRAMLQMKLPVSMTSRSPRELRPWADCMVSITSVLMMFGRPSRSWTSNNHHHLILTTPSCINLQFRTHKPGRRMVDVQYMNNVEGYFSDQNGDNHSRVGPRASVTCPPFCL